MEGTSMHWRRALLVPLALSGSLVLAVAASGVGPGRPKDPASFMVLRGDPLGNLGDGTVKMLEGSLYDVDPGRLIALPTPNATQINEDGFVRPGYWVNFTAQPAEGGRVRVALAVEYTSAVEKA